MKRAPRTRWRHLNLVFLLAFTLNGHTAEPATLDTARTFPEIETLPEWKQRAELVRQQVAFSNGLWPMPEKTPLNARIFDRLERADYSIEKVTLEVHPGVYLAGNLFRPIGKGRGPYPGILNPHGHWSEGRLVDSETGSVFARCIQFARLGMVAFAYDMAGYNDSTQFSPRNERGALSHDTFYDGHVTYAQEAVDQVWGISLMGLQTWNNIRALDFLESLEDVDNNRIAVTGASGGGTQTFILGAVDNRLAAQVPAVMVSHTMQGGCWCENAPGLRVRFSNVEVAAAAAPRPQMLVGASGDWTSATMEFEGPHIEQVYRLFGPADPFRYVLFDYPHNYNQTSREAVYAFIAQHLLNRSPELSLPEQPYRMEDPRSMRVWPDDRLPANAVSKADYKAYLKQQAEQGLASLLPSTAGELDRFKKEVTPIYQTALQLSPDPQEFSFKIIGSKELADKTRVSDFTLNSESHFHSTRVRIYQPRRAQKKVVVISHPLGIAHSSDSGGDPYGSARQWLDAGLNVVVYDGFLTGSQADMETAQRRNHFENFFSTYNRTDLQEHVGDLIRVCAFVRTHLPRAKLILSGEDAAGVRTLLAAPVADAVVADVNHFANESDTTWAQREWLIPGIRRLGGFTTPALLAAPNPLYIHNMGNRFDSGELEARLASVGAAGRFADERATDPELLKWINAL